MDERGKNSQKAVGSRAAPQKATKHQYSAEGHHHALPFHQLSPEKRKKMKNRFLLAIWINIGITLMEVVMGIIANSMALLSDALHNFSDVLALLLSLLGLYLLGRKAQSEQTFGFQRVELVIGLVNALSLIFIGLLAMRGSILSALAHFRNAAPNEVLGLPVLIASAISVLLNGLSVYILERGEHHSVSVRSSVLHLFSDMLTSVAVCVGGIVVYFFDIYWVDSLISLCIALYIIGSSFQLAKYSIRILLNFNVSGLKTEQICTRLREEPEVCWVSHIHLWSLSEATVMLAAHIGIPQELDIWGQEALNERLKALLREQFHIGHSTLEFHPSVVEGQECELLVAHSHTAKH